MPPRVSPARYNVALYWTPARVQLGVVFENRRADWTGWVEHGGADRGRADPVPSRLMSETTADLPRDWWTTDDVLAFLRSVGAPISRATWAAYVSRGQAPAPDRMFGRSPAWRPAAVREWQASRPRRGSVDAGSDTAASPPSKPSASDTAKSTAESERRR